MSGAANLLMSLLGGAGVINGSLPNGAASGEPGVWSLLNNGQADISGSPGVNWVTPANTAIAALYEVKVDVTSGSFTTGTTGTWLSLAVHQSWTLETNGSVTFTVSFRLAASGAEVSVQSGKTLTVSDL